MGVLPSRDPCPNTESFDDGALSCNVTYGVSAHWWLRPWGRFWRIAIVTSPCRNLLADSRRGIHWQVLYLVRCCGESVTALLGVYDIYRSFVSLQISPTCPREGETPVHELRLFPTQSIASSSHIRLTITRKPGESRMTAHDRRYRASVHLTIPPTSWLSPEPGTWTTRPSLHSDIYIPRPCPSRSCTFS